MIARIVGKQVSSELGRGSVVFLSPCSFRLWLLSELRSQSKVDLGRRLGVSRQAVEGWVAGTIQPSQMVLILAAMLSKQDAGEWPLE